MNKYIKYLFYILEHKKNVFIECWKEELYLHAFTHDLSKFLPSEFIPYARNFYGKYIPQRILDNIVGIDNKSKIKTKEQVKEEFNKAWQLHYKRNKHHPEHWVGRDMPRKYIKQMVCDLKGMSRKFGDTAQQYYLKNYYKWDMTWRTRMDLEWELDLNDSEAHNYGHTLKEFADMYDENTYNNYFAYIKSMYGIDSYKILEGL
nr:MAG TPA: hypothetical protein [Caudoviricetes sp.]